MPYFPTEEDWTMALRPNRIPVGEKFPNKYTVNKLQTDTGKHSTATSRVPQKKYGNPPQGTQNCSPRPTERTNSSNPNLIPLGHEREDSKLSATNINGKEKLDKLDPNQDNTDETSTKVRTNE